jgi:hypothetical protein
MSRSFWQGLVNREKLKVKSSSARRLGRRRARSRRVIFELLEPRVLLANNPYINLSNGVANSYIAGQNTWVQIPVRVDNLQDAWGDVGLDYATVQLSFSTSASIAPPSKNGLTESGNTVTVTTTAAHDFAVGEAVTISGAVDNRYSGTFDITAVASTTFTYTLPTYSNLPVSGSGTATASFFDQGPVQNYGGPNFTNIDPIVIPGPLVPSSGWTFTPGQGAGTLKIVAYSSQPANDITATDPTSGGTAPDGDILAYVFLHVVTGTPPVSNIPINVVPSGTSLVEDIASYEPLGNPAYPTIGYWNATAQVVPGATAPVAQLSVDTSRVSSATVGTEYSVPVMLTPVTPGGPGIASANADILFDPHYIDASSIAVTAGNLLASHWSAAFGVSVGGSYNQDGSPPSVDTAAITLSAVELNSSVHISNLASNSTGSLWVIRFTTMPGVSGSTVLNLVPDALPAFASPTNLWDGSIAYPRYTLSPAPTERLSDPADGTITFVSTTTAVTSSSAPATYGTPVTFTAAVTAGSGSTAPNQGSVEFYDESVAGGEDLGAGTYTASTGTTSTWTLATGAKTFHVTSGDTIVATYTAGVGFADSSGTMTQVVTARPITVTAAAGTKTYDGTVSCAAAPTITGGSLATGDTAAFSETFDNKNAGSGKTLTPAGSVNDGSGGSNYALTFAVNTAGSITARAITVTAATSTKGYDGNPSSPAAPAITGGNLVTGDTAAFAETFDTRNAGSGKTLTPAGSVNDANNGGNYAVTLVDSTTGSITVRAITVTAATSTKGYDGTTSCPATPAITGGSLAADDTAVFSESFDTPALGTGKLLTPTGSIGDGNNGNNYAVTWVVNPTGEILAVLPTTTTITTSLSPVVFGTPLTFTAAVAAPAGGTAPKQGSVDFVDTTTGADLGPGAFAGSTGTTSTWTLTTGARTLSITAGDTITAFYAPGAGFSGSSGTAIQVVTPIPLVVVGITAYNRPYTGYSDANLNISAAALEGVSSGDAVTLGTSAAVGTFASKNVGQNITVSVSGLTIGGAQAAYYTLTQPSTTAAITAKVITLTATSDEKVYDGTNNATAGPTLTGGFLAPGDTLAFSEAFDTRNVGTAKTLTVVGSVNDGDNGNDYAVCLVANTTGQITARAITVTAAAGTKSYDGMTTASATPTITSGSLATGDTAAFSETFDTKNAGTAKTLTPAGSVSDGNGGNNYSVTFNTNTAGSIAARAITVTAVASTKGYDGGTSSPVAPTITGGSLATGDTAAFSESFDTRNAGAGKTLTPAASVSDGNGGNNYSLTFNIDTAGRIVARAITVTATAGTKGYDGSTSSPAAPTITGGSLATGDAAVFSESFDTNQAGAGKTLAPAGSVSDGNSGNNYSVTFNANTAGSIAARAITVTAVAGTKGYDGSTSSSVAPTITGGNLSTGDTAAFTETFDTRNVGTGKTLTVAGSVNDGNGGNNYAVSFAGTTTGRITARSITVTAGPDTKTYDATTTATATPAITSSSLATGDTAVFTESFDTKNAGIGKTLTATGSVDDGNGGANYAVTYVSDTTGDVNPATLTVSAAAVDKVYDGLTTATVDLAGNQLAGDTVILSDASAAFTDKDVGTGKTVSVSGIAIQGADAANYSLPSTTATTAANITPAPLTAAGITAADKTYDGNATAVLLGLATASLVGVVSGDTVTLGVGAAVGTFASPNVAQNTTVSLSGLTLGGTQAQDYVLTQPTTTANITARVITVTASTGTKVYDGTTASTAAPSITAGSLAAGDKAAFAETYDTKDAGTGKTLTPAGSVDDGNSGNNYAVTFVDDTTGDITPAPLTVSATGVDKVYDGTTAATVDLAGNQVPGDALSFDYASAAFSSQDVGTSFAPPGLKLNGPSSITPAGQSGGTAQTVTVTGIAISGPDASNYILQNTLATTTADITPKPLTVSGITAADKTYDGTTTATLLGVATASLSGVVSGDKVDLATAAVSGAFADKQVGTDKQVFVSGLSIDNTNYNLAQLVTPAAIFARGITVTAVTNAKVYDTTVSAKAVPTVTGGSLAPGDSLAFAETYNTPNAGTGLLLTPTGSVSDGNEGNNYAVTFVNTNTGVINQAPLTVTVTGVNRAYDGLTDATVTFNDNRISGDTFTDSCTSATFAGKNAGAETVTATGITISGPGASNYSLQDTSATTTADITPAPLTVSGITVADMTYNGGTTATLYGLATASLGGVVSGDTVTLNTSGAAGTFASQHAGRNMMVLVSGLTISGAQSGDYVLTQLTATANITPATLTVAGITAADKAYNANTVATLSTAGAALAGVFSGDAVTLGTSGAIGTFASKDAAQNITVSVSGLTVSGAQADDYTLVQPVTTANITPATLTVSGITAAGKVYNANTVATLGAAGAALVGVFSGDAVTLGTAGAVGTFAGKNAGQGVPVTVSGLTISGAQAADYLLTQPATTANISALPITVTAAAATKLYDGTSLSAAVPAITGGSLLAGDTAAFSEGFGSKNAGTVALVPAGSVADGNSGENYAVTFVSAAGSIAPLAITVAAASNVKIYDGNVSASAVPAITSGSLVTGDAAAFSEAFDNKNAGFGKTLRAFGSVNDGNHGGNYTVTFVDDIVGVVVSRPITVTAAANSKVYDGTTSASAVPTITSGSLAAGDAATWTEAYDTPAVGTGRLLVPSGTVSDGAGGADYSVTFVANSTGVITQTVDHFVVTTAQTSVTAGNSILLVVTAEDAGGNIVTNYGGSVDFTSSDPLEPHPADDVAFVPGSGVVATLANLESAGSWTITAAATPVASIQGRSVPITVTAAPASAVIFCQPPANTTAGATINRTVMVQVVDRYGNVVSSGGASMANVTLAIASGPRGGKLLGPTTAAASGGVATFGNLSIDVAGSYTMTATVAGLNSIATLFTVTAGPAAQLAFTLQPANTPGSHTMANVNVSVEDQYGNTVTTDSSSVTLTLNAAASGGGGVLEGTTTVSASGGVATFGGLSIVNPSNNSYSAAGTGYTLWASDGSLTAGKSAAFNTTLVVASCTMTATGFVATFSQPFEVATTPVTIGPNLYGAVATNNLPVNVSLIGSNEGTVRGSLVVNSTNTQITFVATTLVHSTGLPIAGVSSPNATSGILAPDDYTVVLDSTSTSFVTTNGQLLDGADSGTGGRNFNQSTAVDNSADVDVVIPSFARGPSSSTVTSTVNVLNVSTPIFATSALSIASSTKNGATESGNTVTVTTNSAHGLVAGQTVLIAGFSGAYSGYNGTFTVASVPTTTTFTYTDSTTGLGKSGGGTVTGYGLTESGHTVTVWTTVSDGLAVGEPVTISGAGVAGYNGTFTVASLPGGSTGTTFTYTDANAALANSGGGTAALARGIPISLRGPTGGVTSGTFTLTYSSSDLTISGALVDPSLAASYGATLSLDVLSTPGNAIIDFNSTTALPSAAGTPILLGGLTATVPSTAYYKTKDLLHFTSVTLHAASGSVAAIGADALHLVVFAGNASGSGAIASADVLDMARVVAGADAGFAAYPLIDPDVIGDLMGDGTVDGPDGALLGRYVNGVTTLQIPVYPGAPLNKLSVAASTVSIPSAPPVAAGSSVTAPATVVDMGLPVLADATDSMVASPVAPVKTPSPVLSLEDSPQRNGLATPARVPSQLADSVFTALARGAVDPDELAVLGSIAGPAVYQESPAQTNQQELTQTDLDHLLWESGDSS